MASSQACHNSESLRHERACDPSAVEKMAHSHPMAAALWMATDVLTILLSGAAATYYRLHWSSLPKAEGPWYLAILPGRPMSTMPALLLFFALVLVLISGRLHLYTPLRFTSVLHEQRLSLQACLSSAVLLICAIYVFHAAELSRAIVLLTVGLVVMGLGARRLVYRVLLLRSFAEGVGTRNVLIVGTGPEAVALKSHLDSLRYLGYTFKGFVATPQGQPSTSADVVGTLDTLFDSVRKHFADEILFTDSCPRDKVESVLHEARQKGVGVRVVPDLYEGAAWYNPVEYVGQFPIIPLHYGRLPEAGHLVKRSFDIVFSGCVLLAMLPLFAFIALAIRIDSPGPVFYLSDRIGKRGRIFRCVKFRTMVADAEKRKADLMHRNERDDVLFKVADDPRITRLGHFLRKYSLDELPQFWNVLKGEMSVVGPRPPLGSEVSEYKLNHLRRLDVTPGVTGLWQVEGRCDPSFASYVSLDVSYIDNWSLWLDFKIILRTIGVVVAGTGS